MNAPIKPPVSPLLPLVTITISDETLILLRAAVRFIIQQVPAQAEFYQKAYDELVAGYHEALRKALTTRYPTRDN